MSEKDKQRRIFEVDGEVDELVKEGDKGERWWQYQIARHPEMLEAVIRDLEGIDVELRFLGIELGGIDVLFGDNRGLLNIVETKLIKNPQAKREVLAQVLDYAADLTRKDLNVLIGEIKTTAESKESLDDLIGKQNAEFHRFIEKLNELERNGNVGHWKAVFAAYLKEGKVPDEVDEKIIKNKGIDAFVNRIERLMGEGSARLIIAMDGVREEFLRVFNYFKRITSSKAQLVGVVLDRQEIDEKEYFIPHLVGSPEVLSPEYYYVERKTGKKWTLEEFLDELKQKSSEELAESVRDLEEWINKKKGVSYKFGEGETGSLNIHIGKGNRIFAIWTTGSLQFSEWFLESKRQKKLISQEQESRIWEALERLSFFNLFKEETEKAKKQRGSKYPEPSVSFEKLGSPRQVIDELKGAIEQIAAILKES